MTVCKAFDEAARILGRFVVEYFDALSMRLSFFDISAVDLASRQDQFFLVSFHVVT